MTLEKNTRVKIVSYDVLTKEYVQRQAFIYPFPETFIFSFKKSLEDKIEFHIYASAGRFFFERDNNAYDAEAAEPVWKRTLVFLKKLPKCISR